MSQRLLPILLAAYFVCSVSLLGCATATYPADPALQADVHVGRAKTEISRGNAEIAAQEMLIALDRPTGDGKVRSLLASAPAGRAYLVSYLSSQIGSLSQPAMAVKLSNQLSLVKNAGVLPSDQLQELDKRLTDAVVNGHSAGSVPFTLTDDISKFPSLANAESRKRMVNNTIASLQRNDAGNRREQLISLMEYVLQAGPASGENARIEALLPSLNIRRSELDVLAQMYPDYAAQRLSDVSLKVAVVLNGGDRLLRDDLTKALQGNIRGVDWVSEKADHQVILVVERIRQDERVLPERTQTVSYPQYQVDTLQAVMLMPRNATYMFDHVTGSAEIEYGYAIDATGPEQMRHEELVRGKVGGTYGRCQNRRIQNVFGGVSAAEFTANDDMRSTCSGPTDVSIEQLRQEVLLKVVEGVKRVPAIGRVHELNR